jgi:anti-sigma regulatory factor (Ser/Thr protein kinase)
MLIEVTEPSQTGEARRKALRYAEDLQLEETRRGAVALATTEMATNLIKHAGKGYILLQPLKNGHSGMTLMSVDKGPGIVDIPRALGDGNSTAGSMGSGLGAIKRISDAFDLYSAPGSGTVVCAEFRQGTKTAATDHGVFETRVVSEPIAGEDVCGDGWGVRSTADADLFMVVDGLGHGILAAEAAREAERVFGMNDEDSPAEIVRTTHAALKKTRGAALGIAKVRMDRGLLSYAGVGNISATIVSPASSRSIASHNGIVGQITERVQEFTLPWHPNSILVLHSDGLATRWDLGRYAGIWGKPPSLIAAVLHRDFCRGRDDVTVLIAKPTQA